MSFRRALVAVLVLLSAGFALAGASCETTGQGTANPDWPPRRTSGGRD